MTDSDEFKRFRKRVYSRVDEYGNKVMGVQGSSPDLTISRLRRCQNCIHFDTEEKALSYFNHCIERDKKTLRARGITDKGLVEHVKKLERGIRDQFGAIGICLIRDKRSNEADPDDPPGDFNPFHYQCDQWSGQIVVTAAEAAADPSAQEVFDNLKKVDR